jgi:hypothetical protein
LSNYLFKILVIGLILIAGLNAQAQTGNGKSDMEQITATFMDYIEGTANGEPDRLKKSLSSRL